MPLLLGTKRSHEQFSSDCEDDDTQTATSSSVPSPYTIRTPQARKRKTARYSIPSDSPTNMFKVGNESLFQNKPLGQRSLPLPVKTHLQLRFQLKRFNVFRIVQVPTNYTFRLFHSLLLFLFGWDGDHAHQFRLVKDIAMYSGSYKPGEIKSSRAWVDLYDQKRLGRQLAHLRELTVTRKQYEEDSQRVFKERGVRLPVPTNNDPEHVDDESKWTLERLWGSKGVFTKRAVIYEYDLSSPWTVEITLEDPVTLSEPCNDIDVLQGRGAPPEESPATTFWGEYPDEEPESKDFTSAQFNQGSFARFLKGELTTFLGNAEFCVCTPQDCTRKWKAQRAQERRDWKESQRSMQEEGDGSDNEEKSDDSRNADSAVDSDSD